MKTQEEIEQIAEKYATSIYGFSNENYINYLVCKRHYIEGYSQCQENMAKKLKQVDIICPKCKGINQYFIVENNYKCAYTDCEHIFNKQD